MADYIESEDREDEDGQFPVIDSEKVDHKLILQQLISKMSDGEKTTFIKILQFKAIMELLEAMKDMKNTTADTWKHVIMRLRALMGINAPGSKFDFAAFLKTLIPMVGAIAGTCLACRAADEALIDAAEPEETILDDKKLEEAMEQDSKGSVESVVLNLCKENGNNFSLDGSE